MTEKELMQYVHSYEFDTIMAHIDAYSDISLNSIKRIWRDENNIICIEYKANGDFKGNWWHYDDLSWW